jgi:hypothetical protein
MDADAIAAAKRNIDEARAALQNMSLRATAAEFSPAVNHVAVKLPDF